MIKRGCVLVAIVILLTGCLTNDRSLVTGTPCLPPCWHNIVPGETRTQDALETLSALPFVKTGTITVEELSRGGADGDHFSIITWQFRGDPSYQAGSYQKGGKVFIREDVVVAVEIYLSHPMQLEEVLEVQGAPALVRVGVNPDASLIYTFAYPQNGLILYGTLRPPTKLVIKDKLAPVVGKIKVTEVVYFSPMELNEFYSQIRGFSQEQASGIALTFQPWPGLGATIEIDQLK